MRTVVCVKQIPDPTIVRFNIETGCLENVHYIIDPVDEVAVSEAIRIRERSGGRVTAITLGPPAAEDVLRSCLKMGADDAIHLCDDVFENIDAYTAACVLAHVIAKRDYGLILCGRESLDEGNGFLGPAIAETLDLPLVTAVTRIDVFADTNSAVVHRRLKGGDREIIECPLPAVFAVELSLSKPIYPPLRTILAGCKKEIVKLDAPSIPIDMCQIEPTVAVLGISQPRPRLKKTATVDTNLPPHERIKLIVAGGVQQKTSKFVDKQPKAAATDIIQFLLENGIISRER